MLRIVRLAHTLAWAIFASAIIAIPLATWLDELRLGMWLSALVFVEVAILAANGMHCPLSAVARRYTAERSANFDIYLPVWLARHNKLIFGALFVVGEMFLGYRWIAG